MKYAILNNKRIEPQKGIIDAVCPICEEIVIPKCGNIKIHHWAHKTKYNCDPWWENETEWHRKWKDLFPEECQEFVMIDNITSEKHIADVRINNLTLEFQHSSISENEKTSRENFYKNMFWIVDARKYYEKFKNTLQFLNHSKRCKICFYYNYDEFEQSKNCFPKRWLNSKVPVIFDFGIHENIKNEFENQKKWLYCIFPNKFDKGYNRVICGMYFTKKNFVNMILNINFSYKKYEKLVLDELSLKRQKEQDEHRKFLQQLEDDNRNRQKLKFQKECTWRNAIRQLNKDISSKNINPVKLKINYQSGEIVDNKNKIYNNKRCIVLAINSYLKKYQDKEYMKNVALLLVENSDDVYPALIKIPTPIINAGKSFEFKGLLHGKYNRYIRTMETIPYFDKLSIWFDEPEYMYMTKMLKTYLDNIKNKFKLYSEYFEQF